MGGRARLAFRHVVETLKSKGKTVTVVESAAGGLIGAGIMAVPGSSAVYFGGSVAYNTRRAKPLLLDDAELHGALVAGIARRDHESEADHYVRSKEDWTARTAVAFCEALQTDYAISEGGAAGPSFRQEGLDRGFAILCVAGRHAPGEPAALLAQRLVRSEHADREQNMHLFAAEAAKLLAETIGAPVPSAAAPGADAPARFHFDRDAAIRDDDEAVRTQLQAADARFVICKGSQMLFSHSDGVAMLSAAEAAKLSPQFDRATYLGQLSAHASSDSDSDSHADSDAHPDRGSPPLGSSCPVFAVDASDFDAAEITSSCSGGALLSTRVHAPLLEPSARALALYAHGLLTWQRRSAFCASCGAEAALSHAGHARRCGGCGGLAFPRQDPAIIVVVSSEDGERVLLARSPRHPQRYHTALAGFVEVGEHFEEAVAREVFEETGVKVLPDSIEYVASQPWPFPQSSMIGFRAKADARQPLVLQREEILSAHWFGRSAVAAACAVEGATTDAAVAAAALQSSPELKLLVPPAGVLARTLIESWLGE